MVEKFTRIQSQAGQIEALAGRLARQMQFESDTVQPLEVESLYNKVSQLKAAVTELVDDFYNNNPRTNGGKDGAVLVPIQSISVEEEGCVGIRFDSPPVLKTSIGVRTFAEEFCIELQQKLVMALPDNFTKYSAAYVIYVSHFVESAPKRQPYFDNDNLAIKQILDSVVPYICLDDAAKFCDNLYFSEPDSACFTELYVVEKSKIGEWLSAHRGLQFCREALRNST